MATKLYFRRRTTDLNGTYPAAGVSVSTTAPTQISSGVNRVLDVNISRVAQTSQAATTNAVTTAQSILFARFVSARLAAQTIAAQTITFSDAADVSNANSALSTTCVIVLWRPSTGVKVGAISDVPATALNSHTTTSQTAVSGNLATSTSQTAQDGDVIIAEIWRSVVSQGKASAFTNTIFYDGTTEASTTNEASFISFANTLTFLGPEWQAVEDQFHGDPRSLQVIGQAVNRASSYCLGEKWARCRSGLIVPSADRPFAFA